MTRTPEQDALSRIAVGVIRQAFAARNTTLTRWAKSHGYQAPNCSVVMYRWGWRVEQQPHGGLARQVMAHLLADFPQLRKQLKTEALRRKLTISEAA